MEKKILGLDLGTNSIGWALISTDEFGNPKEINGMGSRIIPMTQDVIDAFSGGKPLETQTAIRTKYRSTRRLRERYLLRRQRLHRILNIMGFLPNHYASQIDFEKRLGQFFDEKEPKLAYDGKEFIFKESFNEMLNEFKNKQPQMFRIKPDGTYTKIPYDWTIYYLRKKALTQKIKKEELAWIILNFNQKRGYYQLRGEDEEKTDIKEYCEILKIVKIEKGNKDKKNDKKTWYKIYFENGWEYSATFLSEPNWLNTEKDFLITEELDNNGNVKKDKNGKEKRRITPLPSIDEINLMSKNEQDKIYKKIKARTEITIRNSNMTVGAYIYENLLNNPSQKIRGKLVRTIERKFYEDELKAILENQIKLQPELFSNDLYNKCVHELYKNNEDKRFMLNKRDFIHLIVNDIIFYQRPLRSQKSLIGKCSLEYRVYKDKDGNTVKDYLRSIPKSHPLYQEFRVWQFLYNLKIYRKEGEIDVTSDFIKNSNDFVSVFEFLMTQNEVEEKDILTFLLKPILEKKYPNANQTALKKELNNEIAKYRWNYDFKDSQQKKEDKSKIYPCNKTGYEIRKRLEKVINVSSDFLTPDVEKHLWHIIYSVKDKNEYIRALEKFAKKYSLDNNSFVAAFKDFPPFKSEYGAYSEKAVKKLLQLMRVGKYWSWEAIDDKTKERIDKIITGEYDEKIKERVREKAINLKTHEDFQGLPLWLASFIIYDRHSEAAEINKWETPNAIDNFLNNFKQHSLRNPIVEQVITETLRVVNDIWKHYGNGAKNFFNEIHVELGRELKNDAETRQNLTNEAQKNEATNMRIKALLMELKNNSDNTFVVENINPNSPSHQELLKIYEADVLNSTSEIPKDIIEISKASQPSKTELQRYKLWLEQKYCSPYTGKPIPLGRLFTEDYQIEHIIPKSRFFDDSFNNKVICESAVNQLKDNQLPLEFIKKHQGEEVTLGMGQKVTILTEEAYKKFVDEHYAKNKIKHDNLLLEDIPDKMIARQINDTRYISKYISTLLSNIVREEKNDDEVNSKNIIFVTGKITSKLKEDWGLNAIWNDLILPRFERLNHITGRNDFTYWNEQYQKFVPAKYSPIDDKIIDKKRIDHRHHAMDALVIACTTRDHVNLLNNQSAKSNEVYYLHNKLRNKEKVSFTNKKTGKISERYVFTEFKKPWENFTEDAKKALESIVVSFKQNLRIINKTTNYYQKFVEKNGKMVKEYVKQDGTNWAIRKPLHKETVSGKVTLPHIKVPKDKVLTATRKSLDKSFDIKRIEHITDTGIQKILKNYLKYKNNDPEIAFSPEGIEEMNANIKQFNDGKYHQPIKKVRIFEEGSKFVLGEKGNKKFKYVEAAKGTNLFFAIYISENGNKRSFETIPLIEVIERLKQGLKIVPETNKDGDKLLFYLSPNDLVYVPTKEEIDNKLPITISDIKIDRIYKFVDSSDTTANFVPVNSANVIFNLIKKEQEKLGIKLEIQNEYGLGSSLSKNQNSLDGIQIKSHCIKLKINRLGHITLHGSTL